MKLRFGVEFGTAYKNGDISYLPFISTTTYITQCKELLLGSIRDMVFNGQTVPLFFKETEKNKKRLEKWKEPWLFTQSITIYGNNKRIREREMYANPVILVLTISPEYLKKLLMALTLTAPLTSIFVPEEWKKEERIRRLIWNIKRKKPIFIDENRITFATAVLSPFDIFPFSLPYFISFLRFFLNYIKYDSLLSIYNKYGVIALRDYFSVNSERAFHTIYSILKNCYALEDIKEKTNEFPVHQPYISLLYDFATLGIKETFKKIGVKRRFLFPCINKELYKNVNGLMTFLKNNSNNKIDIKEFEGII